MSESTTVMVQASVSRCVWAHTQAKQQISNEALEYLGYTAART